MTFEQAKVLMEDRGYTLMSSCADRSVLNFITDDTDTVIIHARVKLKGKKDDSVQLSYNGLKLLITMQTAEISLAHPDFERFENALRVYVMRARQLDKDIISMVDDKIKLEAEQRTAKKDGCICKGFYQPLHCPAHGQQSRTRK